MHKANYYRADSICPYSKMIANFCFDTSSITYIAWNEWCGYKKGGFGTRPYVIILLNMD